MEVRRYLFLAILALGGVVDVIGCTSAIVSGELTQDGRPILWKHRDTGQLDNKVERIAREGEIPYVALFNSVDTLCREAWIGMNERGFAIMNTASYNLKNDTVSSMDHEGEVMSLALGCCRTVADFESLLKKMPKPLGVEANFGVIDAEGGAAYFETDNWSFRRYDVSDSGEGYLIRTNYSKSGREMEGYGYVRESNAEKLLAPYVASKSVTPAVFTEVLSRSFYHSLIGKDFAQDSAEWVVDNDFIPRYSSSASVAIVGAAGKSHLKDMTMWTVLGYPPCGVVVPVTMENVPEDLKACGLGGNAPACDRANLLKKDVFSRLIDRGEKYLNIKALYRLDGNGISQQLTRISREVYCEKGIVLE